MADEVFRENQKVILERENFQGLLDALDIKGYKICGPTIKDSAIVYDEISLVDELPIGWIDHQDGGYYRLMKAKKDALFGYVVGSDTWKKFLYPVSKKLFKAKRNGKKFKINEEDEQPLKQVFIGVRSCELHAIAILDKVLAEGPYPDAAYIKNRQNLFIIAVNCTRSGGTCFCVSMNTGPKVVSGFDLALTEVLEQDFHYFLVEVGSKAGADLITKIPNRNAKDLEIRAAEKAMQYAEKNMGRFLDTNGIKELLQKNFEHPRWEQISQRCLTCGNCTMVCPTCFCSTIEDITDLTGQEAQRWRKLDSCFTLDFSYIFGGSVRSTPASRYRQWMMHKLANWVDQFGTFGCVGCGRCITWCPVGIDIVEEVKAIRGDK